jgi:hypothetical protein
VHEALNDATRRLFGQATLPALRLTTFAILDVPLAGRRHVVANEMPAADVNDLISAAYWPLARPRSKRKGKSSTR